ncbi:hypothetical protein ANN_22571 [Periplaneta americana]|uniref:Uncharacterized protein n=1 Tax=Periplaneta americana TaxID=6978 RepID=A0ABQ8S955_PERAM|nr:hypothetical protein ANN_22571 [Periplaneta americana]
MDRGNEFSNPVTVENYGKTTVRESKFHNHKEQTQHSRVPIIRTIRTEGNSDKKKIRIIIWDRVFVPPLPRDLQELKTRIREAAATVTEDMLKRVWEEFDYRLDICRVTRGSHIESLLSGRTPSLEYFMSEVITHASSSMAVLYNTDGNTDERLYMVSITVSIPTILQYWWKSGSPSVLAVIPSFQFTHDQYYYSIKASGVLQPGAVALLFLRS